MSTNVDSTKTLQHEGKMSLKDRMEESLAFGEAYRAEHSGPDQREAVKPLHAKPAAEKVQSSTPESREGEDDAFTESL